MKKPALCAHCGVAIPPDAPEGVCPACAFGGGLDSAAAPAANLREEEAAFHASQMAELAVAFPNFELLELLGRGGMGEVYKARQKRLDRLVAIKILPEPFGKSDEFTERFLREAQSLAQLNHPNIVTIYDFGETNGLCYFVMEFIEGVDLKRALQARTLTPEAALQIVPQICDALQYAHDAGIVHRDIKPANILLGKKGRVKIADFGLAKIVGKDPDKITLTSTGAVLGTPEYMAPEQRRASLTVDHRADIYSLGVVFYEMLTGEIPVGRFEPPSRTIGVDARLDEIILHTLEREPERRYQHVSEVKNDVEGVSSTAAPLPAWLRTMKGFEFQSLKGLRGWRRVAALGAIVLLFVFCALAVTESTGITKFRASSDRTVSAAQSPAAAVAPFSAEEASRHQEAWARHLGLAVQQTNSAGMLLRLIPPGEFEMGSVEADLKFLEEGEWFFAGWAAERLRHEFPRHRVKISRPFALGAHEVTVGQFRKFIAANLYKTVAERAPNGGFGWRDVGWQQSREFNWSNPGYAQSEESPVGNVAWEDAIAFCQWLSNEENRTYRLPTEAEWEFACRGGTQTWFHNGDHEQGLKMVANIADETLESTNPQFTWARSWRDGFPFAAPVGRFEPNAFGLHDMHGNVWEWCQDFHDPDYYRSSPAADPLCHGPGRYHVFRGGGWDNHPGFCRSADRYSSHSPRLRTDWAGFRVVLEVAEPKNASSSR